MRITWVIIAIVLAVLCCFLAGYYNNYAKSAKNDLNEERYLRMVSEEDLENARQKISGLETELKRSQKKVMITEKKLINAEEEVQDLKQRVKKAQQKNGELEKTVRELEKVISEVNTNTFKNE